METVKPNQAHQISRAIYPQLLMALMAALISTSLVAQDKEIPRYNSLVYLTHDNDAFKLMNAQDSDYSYGLFFGYQKFLPVENKRSRFIPFGSNSNSRHFFGTELYVQGFTPSHNSDTMFMETRPFAGILALKSYLTSVNTQRIVKFAVELGVRGPASGAEKVQTTWHNFLGIDTYPGWRDQMSNEILFNTYVFFAFPVRLNEMIQLIPETELAIGNHNTYLQPALMLRVGIFNDISKSVLYNAHIGLEKAGKKEMFITGKIFYRAVIVDATLSDGEAEKIGLGKLDKDNFMGGYEIKIHMQARRTSFILGYTKNTADSNFTLRHSYGTIGISYLI